MSFSFRFLPATLALASLLALPGCAALAQGSAGKAFPKFREHQIDSIGRQIGQTAFADIDNDGDLDWIAGQASRAGGEVWWWEYQGPDNWVRHVIGKGNTDVGASVYDVDGDGWLDVLAGSVLLLNSGRPREREFTAHEVGTIYSHDTEFVDIDGDGQIDAIANSDRTGLFWYTIPRDPRQPWKAHQIASAEAHKVHAGISPKAVGDLDGDGDNDVITGQAWYENTDGKGGAWKKRAEIDFGTPDKYGLALKTWVLDMDGDGDLDFVQAEADQSDGRVAWFENDGEANFTRHMIKDRGEQQDFHSLIVADFDNDGDSDVFSCGGPLSVKGTYKGYIWENGAGKGANPAAKQWTEHVVSDKPCHEAMGADVDNDGDIDIAFKPWSTGNEHVYLENLLK